MPTALRTFTLLLPACFLSAGLGSATAAEPARRPNIVLILADDVGYSDYGCFGSEIATPNIDQLAADGLKFTQFYNNAVCVPTRYSLLTGLYPRYVGEKNAGIALTPDVPTLAEVLRTAGYRTSLSGKWHLGRTAPNRPIDRGFEEYYGLTDGCANHFNPVQRDPPFEGGRIRTWMHNADLVTEFPPDFYSSDAIAEHACKQIRTFAVGDAPFFVHVCFTAAHSPLHAKPADIAKYRGKHDAGWDALRAARRKRQLELGITNPNWAVAPREKEFPAWEDEPLREWNANLMTVYAAMIDCLDQNVGRVLATLKEMGHEQDTIVLLLNDNGGCAEQAGGPDPTNIAGPRGHYVSCGPGWAWLQNTPLRRYKGWVHEGGISTPLIVRWPGVVKPGTATNQVGHLIDFVPTFEELADAKHPTERMGKPTPRVEGTSLVPILRGETRTPPQQLFWTAFDNRAMREGPWKLAWDMHIKRWELYDIEADRTEMHDLAAREPERTERMIAAWQAWADRTGAARQLNDRYTLIRVPIKTVPQPAVPNNAVPKKEPKP